MKMKIILLFLLIYCSVSKTLKSCYINGNLVPASIYRMSVGWGCLETHLNQSLISCLLSDQNKNTFVVPCLQIEEETVPFVLSNALISKHLKTVIAEEKFNQVMDCYRDNRDCVEEEPQEITVRVWQPNFEAENCSLSTAIKFHIALLSISLIVGLPAAFILIYITWNCQRPILNLHRDLIIALLFRTFFTLLGQTEVFLPLSMAEGNASGCEAIAVFDTFTANMVLTFWLLEAFYLRKFVSCDFSKEPNLRWEFRIGLGLSILFTIIWIIVMASAHNESCWFGVRSWTQWINDPLRLSFLILQLYLIFDVVRKIINNRKNLEKQKMIFRVRRLAVYVSVLTPLFILRFSLNAAQPSWDSCEEPYYYTMYFIDGMQCAFTTLFLCFLDPEVDEEISKKLQLKSPKQEPVHQGVTTISSIMEKDTTSDVVYSTVAKPESLETVIKLHNKFAVMPKPSIVEFEGDFYDTPRKISTISSYYDVNSTASASINEFEETTEDIVDENLESKKLQRNQSFPSKLTVLEKSERQKKLSDSSSIPPLNVLRKSRGFENLDEAIGNNDKTWSTEALYDENEDDSRFPKKEQNFHEDAIPAIVISSEKSEENFVNLKNPEPLFTVYVELEKKFVEENCEDEDQKTSADTNDLTEPHLKETAEQSFNEPTFLDTLESFGETESNKKYFDLDTEIENKNPDLIEQTSNSPSPDKRSSFGEENDQEVQNDSSPSLERDKPLQYRHSLKEDQHSQMFSAKERLSTQSEEGFVNNSLLRSDSAIRSSTSDDNLQILPDVLLPTSLPSVYNSDSEPVSLVNNNDNSITYK